MIGSIIAVTVATCQTALTIHKVVKQKKAMMKAVQQNFDKNITISDEEKKQTTKSLWSSFWMSVAMIGVDVLMYATFFALGWISPWAMFTIIGLAFVSLGAWSFMLLYCNSAVNVVRKHVVA